MLVTLANSDPTLLRNNHCYRLINHLSLSNSALIFLNQGATIIAKILHIGFDFFDDAFTQDSIALQ